MALCGQQRPVHRSRIGDWILPNLQAIPCLQGSIRYRDGRSIWQRSRHRVGGLSRGGARSDIGYPPARLCLWLPTGDRLRSRVGRYNIPRLETAVLVRSLPSGSDHHFPFMSARDSVVSRARGRPECYREPHQYIFSGRSSGPQEALDPIDLSGSLDGGLQLYGMMRPELLIHRLEAD